MVARPNAVTVLRRFLPLRPSHDMIESLKKSLKSLLPLFTRSELQGIPDPRGQLPVLHPFSAEGNLVSDERQLCSAFDVANMARAAARLAVID
ncbi:uncharacterized protein PgNI_00762 [Pyricularia grisea]|uniref:Uncharacterized protein n=1 Tax=Pyricularia grisea TaxID=148305 RepID=A0A6P8BII2_PYRGI|nr:uncharacterized protein PgNI_00762 [Pyricularia grisea]TLD16520.1 hypothetical protein PgNI_00762 [Pyricularia grisea]